MKQWIIPALCALVPVATCTHARSDYRPNQQPMFGTYSQAYLDRQEARRLKKKPRNPPARQDRR